MEVDPTAWSPGTVAVAATLAAVLAFGSRHLVTRSVPVIGEMVGFGGGAGDLLRDWSGGWRAVGVGAAVPPPLLVGVAGTLTGLVAGHAGLARTLLTVGLLPLGVVGAHRMAAPLGSKRGQVAAAIAYAAVPLPYDALAVGRWSALGMYAAAPWLVGRLARASGAPPFASRPGGTAARAVPSGLGQHVAATGAVTALAALLVPQAPLLVVLMGAGLAAGCLLTGAWRAALRTALAAAGGAAIAALAHLPTTLQLAGSPAARSAWLGGVRADALSGLDVLALRTGPALAGWATAAVLGAAAVPLLIGRRWRLGWAVRAWALALACGGLVWARADGLLTLRLPPAGVVLAPAAAGLALAVALGLAAVDRDVRGRSWRFGIRRIVVGLGVLALMVAAAPAVAASVDGRWSAPRDDYAGLLGVLARDTARASSRVLWVGDPDLVPGGQAWQLDGGLTYTSVPAAVPAVGDLWPATGDDAGAARLGRVLDDAIGGRTSRLGERLAPLGVEFVAVPRRLAPSATGALSTAPSELLGVLAEQLDLARVQVDPGLIVYRNTAFDPDRDGGAGLAGPRDGGASSPAALAVQVAVWLALAAVAIRMRFGASTPSPPRGGDAADAHRAAARAGAAGGGAGRRGVRRAGCGRGRPVSERSEADDPVDPEHRPAHRRGRGSRPARTASGRRVLILRIPLVLGLAALLAGAVVLDRRDGGDDVAAGRVPESGDARLMPAARPATAGSSTWYCAAGTAEADGFADHRVAIVNTGDEDRTATLTIVTGAIRRPDGPEGGAAEAGGPPVTREVAVPAGQRVEVRLGDVVAAGLAAAVVEVDGGGVAVEHQVSGPHGEDVGPCATFAGSTWHLAWGATTRDARDVVVLFNPFPSPATVDGTFVTEDGGREPVRFQGFPVPAGGVVGVDLGDDVTRSQQVAATFRARSGRIVVERIQQFDGSLGAEGLSLDLAVPSAGTTWVFADGEATVPAPVPPAPGEEDEATPAGGDDEDGSSSERIVVYNPSRDRARVEVRVLPGGDDPGPEPEPFRLSVPAGAYEVIDYGDQARIVAGEPHATVVHVTNGTRVVAQRVTVDAGPPPSSRRPPTGEVTAAPGARLAAPNWTFPSLAAGDDETAAFVVFNPDPTKAVRVRLEVPGPGRDRDGAGGSTEVPPGGRVALDSPADAGESGVVVIAAGPVVAERVVRAADGRRAALRPGRAAAHGRRGPRRPRCRRSARRRRLAGGAGRARRSGRWNGSRSRRCWWWWPSPPRG